MENSAEVAARISATYRAACRRPNNRSSLLITRASPFTLKARSTKIFTGLAFLAVSIALAFSQMGRGWWFWMLIPAFGSLGSGIAQYMQIRKVEKGQTAFVAPNTTGTIRAAPNTALPPPHAEWVSPESRYKTGDLVPPSVTENTTRHLEIDKEGKTMTLPPK